MKKTIIVWILAILVTLGSAVYQRLTGPTYPLKLDKDIAGYNISGKLPRSGLSSHDQKVMVNITPADTALAAYLQHRKYRYEKKWNQVKMVKEEGTNFSGTLPKMPPAGKLEYAFIIEKDGKTICKQERATVIRFKGNVPAVYLIPHIIFIFLFMVMSNVVAFKSLLIKTFDNKHMFVILLFIILGGFIFGPIVQKFAFGDLWTGFPFGFDLTDNKILIALVAWVWAVIKRRSDNAKLWVLIAALTTLVIFLIPHSVLGSELNYDTMEVIQG